MREVTNCPLRVNNGFGDVVSFGLASKLTTEIPLTPLLAVFSVTTGLCAFVCSFRSFRCITMTASIRQTTAVSISFLINASTFKPLTV